MEALRRTTHSLLRKSEQIFQTDMVYLAKGGFWLILQQIITVGISFFLTLTFANLISKEEYGLYRFVLTGIGMLSLPALSGLNAALTQAIAQGKEGVTNAVFLTKLKWGILTSVASLATAGYYSFIKDDERLGMAFIIVAILLPLMNAFGIYDNILEGRRAFSRGAIYSIFGQILAAIALTGAMFSDNFLVILSAYLVSWTLLRFFFFNRTKEHLSSIENHEEAKETISFGKHLSAVDLLGSLSSYLDKILVFHYVGATGLAVYSIALAPLEQSRALTKNLARLALPKYSQRSIGEINATVYKRVILLIMGGTVVFGIYIFLAPYLYMLFFPAYLEAVLFSRLYALILLFTPASQLLGAMFFSQPTLIKSIYTSNTITNAALIISLIVCGHLFGITGIVAARVIYGALNFFIGIGLWRRAHRQHQEA